MDRDGVIIENRAGYVRTWQDVFIFPQALAALRWVSTSPYKLVIVSNQSGIGKGLIPVETADEINLRLLEIIRSAGGHIDGVYICPHTPEDHCECRKPRPGMLFQAASDLTLDLSRSMMIGDALTDLEAGQAAGLHQLTLVETGRGKDHALTAAAAGFSGFSLFPDLFCAIQHLIP